MPHFSEHINILMIPTDSCNMNCVYCFHNPYTENFEKMSLQTVKRTLDITAPYYKHINLIWHGGEPLLMGIDFYKQVIELEKKYNCKINNSIQSNLTLLTTEFADFFKENDISISGSFDGTCNEKLRGNSEEILSGRKLITSRNKRCGLIMVVSNENINSLIESYNFFKTEGINYSLNLYLDSKSEFSPNLKLNKNITAEKLCELFDFWAKDSSGTIHVSYFKNILDYLLLNKKTLCSYTSCLGRWLSVKSNGTITPCNRYFPKEYNYGNVYDYTDIGQAFSSSGFENILKAAIERRKKCKDCKIYDYCSGGCNNVALNENGITNNGGMHCQILIAVYNHIEEFIANMPSEKNDIYQYNPLLVEMIKKSIQNG